MLTRDVRMGGAGRAIGFGNWLGFFKHHPAADRALSSILDLLHFSGEHFGQFSANCSNLAGLLKSCAEWRRTGCRSRRCTADGHVMVLLQTLGGWWKLLILDGNAGLCGEDGELLGEGRIWIEGESRLSFAHHVNHFDAG